MLLDLYLAFVLATTVLILIPGPNVTLLVANSLAHGPRRALLTLAGTSSAIALQMVVVALGMTSLIVELAIRVAAPGRGRLSDLARHPAVPRPARPARRQPALPSRSLPPQATSPVSAPLAAKGDAPIARSGDGVPAIAAVVGARV
jgi:hypothetical protein